MRPRARQLSIVVLVSACRMPSVDDAGLGSTGADEPPLPTPRFVDPASDSVSIPVDRTRDLRLRVADVIAGTTHLFVDGRDVGVAPFSGPDLTFDSEAAVFRLRGAMAPGEHRLALGHGGNPPVTSSPKTLDLVEGDPMRLRIEGPTMPLGSATELRLGGEGSETALVRLESSQPWIAHVHAFDDEGRDDASVPVPLVGWAPGLPLAVSASALVWVAENDRSHIWWRTVSNDPIDPTVLLHIGDLDDRPTEATTIAGLMVLGDTLLVEVRSSADIEHPKPGDRQLWSASFSVDEGLGPLRRTPAPRGADLDDIGRALDLSAASPGALPLVVRESRLRARLFDALHGVVTLRPTPISPANAGHARGPLPVVLGAFDSQIWAEPSPVWWTLRWISPGARVPERVTAIEVSSDLPTPAVTQLSGVPVFLFAAGPDAPVLAVATDRSEAPPTALEELRCDQVAVPSSATANERGSIGIVCRRGTDVTRVDARLEVVP